MNRFAFRWHFDRGDLFEHFDPALDLFSLSRLIPESIDEHAYPCDVVILPAFRFTAAGNPLLTFDHVSAVRAGVRGERLHADLGDSRDDAVEKKAVVGDQDDRMWVPDEKLLQPVARFEVEMVGRLVEQQ